MESESPAHKKTKVEVEKTLTAPQYPREKTEFSYQVEQLKRSIREKPNWKTKIDNPTILERYIDEAVAQGATKEAMMIAIEELKIFEVNETEFDFGEIVTNGKVLHANGLIPDSLKESLEAQLDALANSPVKDFHPGSNGKVQDLIHPSLFPYIKGTSLIKGSDGLKVEPYNERPKNQPTQRSWRYEEPIREESKYQWLPAIFRVGASKKTTISSYINNLDQHKHKKLYDDIAKVFDCILPFLSKVVENHEENFDLESNLVDNDDEPYRMNRRRPRKKFFPPSEEGGEEGDASVPQTDDLNLLATNANSLFSGTSTLFGAPHVSTPLFGANNITTSTLFSGPATSFSFSSSNFVSDQQHDQSMEDTSEQQQEEEEDKKEEDEEIEYQVIVKACNYVLQPGQTYEGVWHKEGTDNENIVASAIYYYQNSSCLQDSGLAFRAETPYNSEYGPPGEREWTKSKNIGTIRTPAGRVLVFSNDLQHKVTLLKNVSQTEVGTRKILCFFVVNPDVSITSSDVVPLQQWDHVKVKLYLLITWICKQLKIAPLPRDVIKLIVNYAKCGLSWEEATVHREKLMKERKFFINQKNEEMEREFSLCEH